MLKEIWHRFARFFTNMAEERERYAQEIRRKQLSEYQEKRLVVDKKQIEDVRRIVAEIDKRRTETIERQFDSINYQEFETVMEMVYVLQKAHYAQQKSAWSKE